MLASAAQSASTPSLKTLQAYNTVLRMASNGCSRVSSFTSTVSDFIPALMKTVLAQWNTYTITTTAWRNDFVNDIIPSESYISSIEQSRMNCLSGQTKFSTCPNLKRLLNTLVRFAGDLIIWCPENNSSKEMIRVMLPLLLDATTESLSDYEENNPGEFYITLEKDPQQEDFLQGRMLGNPYSSNDPGMGPSMRDVKNNICQDCELVALLEDDSGMELLVWCTENNESEAMRILYRMRGLLGDATEEFIENLDTKDNEVDNEEVYKMANVMSECGGLEVMLERMSTITSLSRGRSLLTVLLKLFGFCIKVKSNWLKLLDPNMNAIRTMLGVLRLAVTTETPDLQQKSALQAPAVGTTIIGQLLQIMETILVEASSKTKVHYAEFCKSCSDKEDITFLLSSINSVPMKNFPILLPLLMRVLPFLTFGSQEKMESLINHFKPYLNFNEFDFEHTGEDDFQLECFCMLTAGIECDVNGNQLKDLLVEKHIVQDAIEYITAHAHPIKSALQGTPDDWKEFTSKPALKYVLKLLTGISQGHEKTQHLVSAECIPIIHRLAAMVWQDASPFKYCY